MSLSKVNTVYVKKWVDYSSKYGLGYLLSDGTTGIYFNDSTKMSLDQLAQYFFIKLEKLIISRMKQFKGKY
jgi:polo-like kinase 1